MRRTMLAALCAIGLAAGAEAQEPTKLEVGTSLGLAITYAEGEDLTVFGIPGAGTFLGTAAVYVTVFPAPNWMVEPQIHVQVLNGEGDTVSILSGMLQVGYLWRPTSTGSPYVAVHGGGFQVSNGDSDGIGALGGGLGYRWRIGPGGALRVEGRYRRWFDSGGDLDEIAVLIGIGGIFR